MQKLMEGPVVVTTVVLAGFITISFMAMKPEYAGVAKDVVLYLLGAWQSLATAAVTYWIGSSAGSRDKDQTIKSITETKP
jgi:hypothetical protein